MSRNYRQVQAIVNNYRKKFKEVNPYLTENSGIYILTRKDEDGFRYAYVGQAKHILTRLAQHMMGYQHIDLSLKSHGLYSSQNPYGWKVSFEECREELLDNQEQKYIKEYADLGYQLRNKTTGSQGKGKKKIDDYRPTKGYRDGIEQGRKNTINELRNIIDKHLVVSIKPEKANNKISINAFAKFKEMIWGESQNDKL